MQAEAYSTSMLPWVVEPLTREKMQRPQESNQPDSKSTWYDVFCVIIKILDRKNLQTLEQSVRNRTLLSGCLALAWDHILIPDLQNMEISIVWLRVMADLSIKLSAFEEVHKKILKLQTDSCEVEIPSKWGTQWDFDFLC